MAETSASPRGDTSVTRPVARRLALQLSAATLARLVLNTSRRFAYTFAPALSRGLGVPLTAITSLIAVNQATGVLSPVFGPLGDRWGYRVMMLAGLSMLTVGMLAGGLLPVYSAVLLALLLAGLGKSIFDPAIYAYVGERVPYQRRGLAIGVLEFSWAGSSLVGIPLVGLLIDRLGWQSPFFVLGGLGLLGVVALGALIPGDGRQRPDTGGLASFREAIRPSGLRAAHPACTWTAGTGGSATRARGPQPPAGNSVEAPAEPSKPHSEAWRRLRQERAALGALGFGFLISAANDNLFVVYGAWLEGTFGLTIVALGAATTAIGIAELLGEGLTASIADRLGLKRATLTGLALSALSYILLPLMGHTLPLSLVGLFLTFLTFEFTIVTAFSLFTEILPGARATMMSSNLAAISIGRVVGALIGGPVWLVGGLLATGLVSGAISGLALILLVWGLRDWRA